MDDDAVAALSVTLAVKACQQWREFVPLLYHLFAEYPLDWPSLSVDWLSVGAGDGPHLLLLGTQTSGAAGNALFLVEAHTPDTQPVQPAPPPGVSMRVVQVIPHGGHDVNRARAMPQDPHLIATRSDCAEAFVFAASPGCGVGGQPPEPVGAAAGSGGMSPQLVLEKHDQGGFGIAWCPGVAGHLLTAGNDGLACLWDLEQPLRPVSTVLQASAHRRAPGAQTYAWEPCAVNDVAWHSTDAHVFGCVGEGGSALLWDARAPARPSAASPAPLHGQEGLCIAFDPCCSHRLATGGGDGAVAVLDARSMDSPLCWLRAHAGRVEQVAWSPHRAGVLATCAQDARVLVWDVGKAAAHASGAARKRPPMRGGGGSGGDEDAPPPGMLFLHNGHAGGVTDVAWCPRRPWMLASVSGMVHDPDPEAAALPPHVLQLWEMAPEVRDISW